MKRFVKRGLVAVLVVASVPLVVFAAAPEAAPASPAGGNYLLLNEMMLVNKAYRDIVSAVAIEDSSAVVTAIEKMDKSQTVQMTRDALKAGKITTPKNPDKMKEFERMDRDFHKNLERLLGYAKTDNRPKIRYATKKLLDDCIQCHERFRK